MLSDQTNREVKHMGQQYCNAKSKSYKHLTYKDRLLIEILAKEKCGTKEIANRIGVSQRTIQRELRRGQIQQLNGSTWTYYSKYDADFAQRSYNIKQRDKGPTLKIGHNHSLAKQIETMVKNKISPDIIAHWIKQNKHIYGITLCTQTIYNYIEKNVFISISSKDLIYGPYKQHKDPRTYNRPSYKNLKGKSIELRAKEVLEREQYGHWEMDLIVGQKKSAACLLVLTERKSRGEIILKLPNKSQHSVITALDKLERKYGTKKFRESFLSITVDNGSEFLASDEMECSCLSGKRRTQVYYAHPYSAFERGSNENLNRMIRRFIPKGCDINKYSKREILRIQNWLNNYPRKILSYKSPNECFSLLT